MPTFIRDITKFVITDELHELLQVSTDELNAYKVSVYVNGSTDADATLTDLVTVENGRNVTLDMTSEMANYKGDRIHLAIEAQLKDGITVSELDGLITAENATGSIPNKATLQLTDSPDEAIETNEVIVTPQRGDVVLTKTADGVALSDGQVAKFDLYRGIAPAGEKVNVEVLVTEEGELTVPGLLPADYYFVEIESPAGYVLDATAVPFKIVGGRTVAAQNPVEVTVDNASADQPQPEKKVDTVDALLLDTFDQTFTFTIDVPVTDTRHISSFVITDTLDEFLEFVPDSWQVNLANASGTIVREGQMLTYTASEDDIAHMSNTTVTLSFAAKVKSDLDVSALKLKYADLSIPNQAELTINNDSTVETNKVTVTPKLGKVTLYKTADGEKLPINLSATFALYKSGSETPIGTYSTIRDESGTAYITVEDLLPGSYYFVETQPLKDTSKTPPNDPSRLMLTVRQRQVRTLRTLQ